MAEAGTAVYEELVGKLVVVVLYILLKDNLTGPNCAVAFQPPKKGIHARFPRRAP